MTIPASGLFLIGASSAGARPFFQQEVLDKISSMEFIALQIIVLILVAIIILWKYNTASKIKLFTKKTWLFLFASIVVTLVSAYVYFILLQKKKAAIVVAILNPLTIVFTVLIGWIFFKDTLNTPEIIGIILILGGVVLTQLK